MTYAIIYAVGFILTPIILARFGKRLGLANHEAWRRCRKCASFFDLRNHGWTCPHCGSDNG